MNNRKSSAAFLERFDCEHHVIVVFAEYHDVVRIVGDACRNGAALYTESFDYTQTDVARRVMSLYDRKLVEPSVGYELTVSEMYILVYEFGHQLPRHGLDHREFHGVVAVVLRCTNDARLEREPFFCKRRHVYRVQYVRRQYMSYVARPVGVAFAHCKHVYYIEVAQVVKQHHSCPISRCYCALSFEPVCPCCIVRRHTYGIYRVYTAFDRKLCYVVYMALAEYVLYVLVVRAEHHVLCRKLCIGYGTKQLFHAVCRRTYA